MEHYRFILYIAGHSARSERATQQLLNMCEQALHGRYELVVIDVLEQTEVAEQEKILATPTLVKESPLPKRRITGDLSDLNRVLAALGIVINDTDQHTVT